VCLAILCATLSSTAGAAAPNPVSPWCAPGLDAVTDTVCFYAPATNEPTSPRTLVIFLHSLVGVEGAFARQQQRLVQRHADRFGFSVLFPRGRAGFGPGRDPKVLAWPTARVLQEAHEEALIAEWRAARELVEKTRGPFERTWVFGFSNGAYYGASLALRGKLKVDGYGVFAGGNGGRYHRLLARAARRRRPIFVGYGTKDPDHRRQRSLIALLDELGWPHASRADRVGHTVSDAQMRAAVEFLGRQPVGP
jgi:predicted esterase